MLINPYALSVPLPRTRAHTHTHTDDTRNTSRIVIALFGDVVPDTVNNFKQLVTGKPGYGYQVCVCV